MASPEPYSRKLPDGTTTTVVNRYPLPKTFRAPVPENDQKTARRSRKGVHYSAHIANKICALIMQKNSLTKICNMPGMPRLNTVIGWLADPKRADFREQYYYARRVQAELLLDEIFDIADDTSNDWKPTYDKNGEQNGWKPDNEAIQRSRVKIDTRKWFAAKMVPRLYGDRAQVDLDVTGDLAELMRQASNSDKGLPKPVDD